MFNGNKSHKGVARFYKDKDKTGLNAYEQRERLHGLRKRHSH